MKKSKGSFTIEATLVFVISLLAIGAIIHISMLLYQQACIKAISDRAVKKGAAVWNYVEKDFVTGYLVRDKMYSGGLYWQLLDMDKKEKLSRIEDFVRGEIKKYRILKNSVTVHATMMDYIVCKRLVVKVESNTRLPFGKWLGVFGLGEYYNLFVQSEADIRDTAEMLRTVDFVLDTGKEVERKYPAAAEFGQKTRETIGKTLDGIASFFNFLRKG